MRQRAGMTRLRASDRGALDRWAAGCAVLAPASFVTAWATFGARREGYDPVEQAISQLARVGAPERWGMTAGLVSFGVLLPIAASRLPDLLRAGRPLRASMVLAGVSTLAVAALPLQRDEGGPGDLLHAAAAGVGYLAMTASPTLGAQGLRRSGHRAAAAASVAVSLASATALVVSVTTGPTGLWQRLGLGVVDLWFLTCGLWLLGRGRAVDD